MARAADLKNMDVDELLALRGDVEAALKEQARDLERQIALLDGGNSTGHGKRRGRPAGGGARASALKGKSVPPKYRGPGGETWAGRGATPRWLSALLKEGHSVEEFLIGARRKGKPAAGKKQSVKKKVRKTAAKTRGRERKAENARPAAAD